ncbi:MAG: Cu+-exporting ATPase [Gammaproteobacteria bacterium]|jgi:Cu+-exporting ATPase
MSCASCVNRVESTLLAVPGVRHAAVNLALERAQVDADPAVSPQIMLNALANAGYTAHLAGDDSPNEIAQQPLGKGALSLEARWLIFAALFSAPLLAQMISMSLSLGWHLAPFAELMLATPVQLFAGARFYRGAWSSIRHGAANMDVLVVLGTSAAFIFSACVVFGIIVGQLYFEASAAVITLVLLGKWLEARARHGASAALRELMSLRPQTAEVMRDGVAVTVSVGEVQIGDLLQLRPGGRVAVDGIIVRGDTEVDESLITGESLPVDKHPGDTLIGGTVNGSGTVQMQCTAVATHGRLAQIVALVEDAQMRKAPVQKLVDRVSAVFVPLVLVVATFTFAGWWYVGVGLEGALLASVAVLVIACPCALGLATPTALVAGTGAAARSGILIRDIQALERAALIDTVMFDKTGTLTLGTPRVVQFVCVDDAQRSELLALASELQSASEHPLARALLAFAESDEGGLAPPHSVGPSSCTAPSSRKSSSASLREFRNHAGYGVTGTINNRQVAVGSAAMMSTMSINHDSIKTLCTAIEHPHASHSYIAVDGTVRAVLAFADELRAQSAATIHTLQERGIEAILLSGDHEAAAADAAQHIGITTWYAAMSPQAKAEKIDWLRARGKHVAMVGDGVNDAPALALADLGIAMGEGTDVAIETAGIILMRSDPQLVPAALDVAHATLRTIRQNLFWAFFYNVIGIPLAAFGFLSPTLAGAAMALSSVCVVTNSLRLRAWSVTSS